MLLFVNVVYPFVCSFMRSFMRQKSVQIEKLLGPLAFH
jgi:hypothetical protein